MRRVQFQFLTGFLPTPRVVSNPPSTVSILTAAVVFFNLAMAGAGMGVCIARQIPSQRCDPENRMGEAVSQTMVAVFGLWAMKARP